MAQTQTEIWAPAKINLGLRVLGRRPDGYHEVHTFLVAVDLYDRLQFSRTLTGGVRLRLLRPADSLGFPVDFPLDESNLITRAVRLVERHRRIVANVAITVRKRIPTAAGLGGGSADAAATLRALTHLYHLDTGPEQLATWAAEIGSDVPFFLGSRAAEGSGRGEILKPIDLFRNWWAVLICPSVFLSAKEVYGQLDLTSSRPLPSFEQCRDGEGFFAALRRSRNDLEDVVIRRVPGISCWRQGLKEVGAEEVFVSGSGPTVCGVFRHRPSEGAVQSLRASSGGSQAFIVRPVCTLSALFQRTAGAVGPGLRRVSP